MNRRLDITVALLLMLAATAVYRITWPGNHGDTEDAYSYASSLVPGRANYALWDRNHNLYLPLTKLTFNAARRAAPSLQPFEWLLGISTICGALSIAGVYLFCRHRQQLSAGLSGITALMLLCSYGFWRYSCTPEIYTLSVFLVLATLYQVFRTDTGLAGCIWAGVLGALAVAIHIGNAPAVFLVATAWTWKRKNAGRAAIYLGIVLALTLVHYALPAVFPRQVRPLPAFMVSTGPAVEVCLQPYASLPASARLVRGLLCLPQAWIAPNFLLGFGVFRRWLTAVFAHRNMEEELFLGSAFQGDPLLLGACVTLILLVVAGSWLILALLREPRRSASVDGISGWLLVWVALNAAMVLWKEPDNPELWIFPLPPLLLWIAGTAGRILGPVRALRHLATVMVLLAVHNWLGGMRMLADPETDLNRRIADVVQTVTGEDDIAITGRGPISRTYLEYYTRTHTIDLQAQLANRRGLVLPADPEGRHIYATSDVFDPPTWLEHSAPKLYGRMTDWASRHKSIFTPVASNDLVVVYVWKGSPPDPNEENK